MKIKLFLLGILSISQISFGQTNGVLPDVNLFGNSSHFKKEDRVFIPKDQLEKNNSYDGPLLIEDYEIAVGVPVLKYTHELTYSPAGVLISQTKYDENMQPLTRTVYGRNNNKITSIVNLIYTTGAWWLDSRTSFEYEQGVLTKERKEEYDSGTMVWNLLEEAKYEYIGEYTHPEQILVYVTSDDIVYDNTAIINYEYGSDNNPSFLEILSYDENYLTWFPEQRWIISEWGPTNFKSDFLFNYYNINNLNVTDYIIDKYYEFSVYPEEFVLFDDYNFLTQTYNFQAWANSTVYDANQNRISTKIDLINVTGDTVEYRMNKADYDPCYGFSKQIDYNYSGGNYEVSYGIEFEGETIPYLNSCYVTAYNKYENFSSGNPNGTWVRRYEITQPNNLSITEQTHQQFKVYPNPAVNSITIETLQNASGSIIVTDLNGAVLITSELNGINESIDISVIPQGVYFLQISTENSFETHRFIKN